MTASVKYLLIYTFTEDNDNLDVLIASISPMLSKDNFLTNQISHPVSTPNQIPELIVYSIADLIIAEYDPEETIIDFIEASAIYIELEIKEAIITINTLIQWSD